MTILTWIAIVLCIAQSAMFSGLNLAFFSISKLRPEIEAAQHNRAAIRVLKIRKDSNLLLTTVLWGNVGVNVLLALLSNSVMTGLMAFLFSTFLITFCGEIIPQAYFSRHALKMASMLSPIMRFYQILFYVLSKPTSLALDKWLGPEAIHFFQEKDFEEFFKMHIYSPESDIAHIEGRGALNFLAFDDLPITSEGEIISPDSIIKLPFLNNRPVFPPIEPSITNEFINRIQKPRKKWIIITDQDDEPRMVINSDNFIRNVLFSGECFDPTTCGHFPIIIRDPDIKLGDTIAQLKVIPESVGDDVIDWDIVLFWGDHKRIITGTDVLGRLLRGIVKIQPLPV